MGETQALFWEQETGGKTRPEMAGLVLDFQPHKGAGVTEQNLGWEGCCANTEQVDPGQRTGVCSISQVFTGRLR